MIISLHLLRKCILACMMVIILFQNLDASNVTIYPAKDSLLFRKENPEQTGEAGNYAMGNDKESLGRMKLPRAIFNSSHTVTKGYIRAQLADSGTHLEKKDVIYTGNVVFYILRKLYEIMKAFLSDAFEVMIFMIQYGILDIILMIYSLWTLQFI